jgi:FtsH-binding integral membrane protein
MESDTRRFLNKIVTTIGLGLLWLFISMTMGIYNGWFFFSRTPTIGNYIFYGWTVFSLVGLLVLFRRIWREKFPHG